MSLQTAGGWAKGSGKRQGFLKAHSAVQVLCALFQTVSLFCPLGCKLLWLSTVTFPQRRSCTCHFCVRLYHSVTLVVASRMELSLGSSHSLSNKCVELDWRCCLKPISDPFFFCCSFENLWFANVANSLLWWVSRLRP